MVEGMKAREGYKKTEVGVIPEDWEVVKLKEIIDYTKGYAFKSSEYKENGVRIIRVSDTDYDSIKNSDPIYIDENDYKKYENWSLKENDLILSTVGSKPPMYNSMVGKVVKVDIMNSGSLLNQNAVKLSARNKNESTQLLIFNNLKTKNYLSYIEKIFRGNANQASITLNELFEYQVPLPEDLIEQKAIAKALTDTDNLIQSIEKLIDKKEKIKQGTMQELLTGKKRLDGFSGEWEVKKLVDIGDIVTGNTPSTSDAGNYGGDFLFVGPGDLGTNKYIKNTEKKLSNKGYSLARKYPANSILVTCIGSTIGKMGVAYEELSSNQQINSIIPNNTYSSDFMYYSLSNISNKIKASASEQAVPIINKSTFGLIELLVPELDEQRAIAQILSDMDQEIQGLREKLEKYKAVKKGMMQELLTGRVRLI